MIEVWQDKYETWISAEELGVQQAFELVSYARRVEIEVERRTVSEKQTKGEFPPDNVAAVWVKPNFRHRVLWQKSHSTWKAEWSDYGEVYMDGRWYLENSVE